MPTEQGEFTRMMARVRAGDAEAAAELVRRYEPQIRRIVRLRMTDPRLRRVLDSMDVSQSVLANFFVHAALGELDLERPEQLLTLLATMTRNKVRDHARRQYALRRDQGRVVAGNQEALQSMPAHESTPSQIIASRELLQEVQQRLSEEDRWVLEQRMLGREWADLAEERGEQPEALRKHLSRALSRAVRALGLEEE
jgi:RNA polymerase sigma-70 factor (ECF subfamily)